MTEPQPCEWGTIRLQYLVMLLEIEHKESGALQRAGR